jgi:predicted dehydrogenase
MSDRKTTIRLGLVGCGEVTRAKHIPALLKIRNTVLAAVCDIDSLRLANVADKFGIRHRYRDMQEMLSAEEIDAVGICVPPEAHVNTAITAFNAGKHVWIDKPLALTPADCLRIIHAADRAHTIAKAGFHMRFHRLIQQARHLLLSGHLGDIESIHVIWHSPRGDENIPEWRCKRSLGGGALMEISVHHMDLLRYLLESEPVDIVAFARNGVRDDECAVILLRMANGILVTGEFSERAPHAIEIDINGRNALLHLDCLRFDGLEVRMHREVPGDPKIRLKSMNRFLMNLPEGLAVMRRGGDYRDSYFRAWNHFVECIRTGNQPDVSLHDGLKATQAVCRALESPVNALPQSAEKIFL